MVATMHVGLGGVLQGHQIAEYNRLLSEGFEEGKAFRIAKSSSMAPPENVQAQYVNILPIEPAGLPPVVPALVQPIGFWARVWCVFFRK